jgi:hypothetical protein
MAMPSYLPGYVFLAAVLCISIMPKTIDVPDYTHRFYFAWWFCYWLYNFDDNSKMNRVMIQDSLPDIKREE